MQLILIPAPMSVRHPFSLSRTLTSAQIAQARALAARLVGSACVAAPGTSHVAMAIGLLSEDCPELDCMDFGTWRDKTIEDVAGTDPEGLARWTRDPAARPGGGKSLDQVCAALEPLIERLARSTMHRVVAIAEPTIVRAAMLHAIDLPTSVGGRLDIRPLAPVRLSHDGRRWVWRPGEPQSPAAKS